MFRLVFSFLFINAFAYAYQIDDLRVGEGKEAAFDFRISGKPSKQPIIKVNENILEISFAGAKLNARFGSKFEKEAPHLLIKRMSVYSPQAGRVVARFVVNGSFAQLKERTQIKHHREGYLLKVAFPESQGVVMNLLESEQEPVQKPKAKAVIKAGAETNSYLWIVALVVISAVGVSILVARAVKRTGKHTGNRKFLIERLSYCSLGPKMGVALIKVGKEFVLIGTTPQQVSLLTKLDSLGSDYSEETKFERDAFQEVVKQELGKINPTPKYSA